MTAPGGDAPTSASPPAPASLSAAGAPGPASPQAAPPSTGAGRRRLRWLLGAFYAASAVFVLVAVASTVDRASGRAIPSIAAIGFSFVALIVALRCSASAWAALLPGEASPVELRRCVYSSQLGKYVPGGVVQGVGQVAIAGRHGIPVRTAFPAYVVYAGHAALGSLVAGAVLASQASAVGAGWAFGALAMAAVAVTSVSRRVLDLGLRLAQRVVTRLRRLGPLPGQAQLTRGFVFQVAFALLQGASYAALLRSLDHDVPVLAAVGANAIAFGIGLLAVPVPSGLLVREGVLVAILHPVAGAAVIITAAIVQRLVGIAAEVVMLVANRLMPTSRSHVTAPVDLQGAP
jgi:glycosyltransferase 2 family protein